MASQQLGDGVVAVIRNYLDDLGMSMDVLSSTSGIPPRTLARRLHQVRPTPMSIDDLFAIGHVLGVDGIQLLAEARASVRANQPRLHGAAR